MKKLLILIALGIFANNTNAQWQSNVSDRASALNLSTAHAQQMQNPSFGGRQALAKNSVAGPATLSNVNSRTGKHDGGVSRSAVFLFDSIINWNLNTTTMTWGNISKQTDFVYNSYNYELSRVVQAWNGNSWADSLQYTHTYIPNSVLYTNELTKAWNGSTWVNASQAIYTYNSGNDRTSYVTQFWNGSTWVDSTQEIDTYNANNGQTGSLIQTWSGSAWVNIKQDTYTLNSSNYITNDVTQTWNGSAWVNTQQETYTLNSNNDQTSQLYQTWNGSSWVNETLFTDSLNSNNLRVRSIEQVWTSGTWVNHEQYTTTYNSSNKETTDLYQTWTNGVWVNSLLYSLTYATNNDVLSTLDQNWNTSSNTWINSEQTTYTYDANNNETSFTIIAYDNTGTTVIVGDSIHWYYNAGVSGVAAINDNATMQLYPNPAGNFIHADVELKQMSHLQLSLVNLLGQTVWATDTGNVANYKGDIDVADLPAGIYLLELITNGGTQSRQVAVIH